MLQGCAGCERLGRLLALSHLRGRWSEYGGILTHHTLQLSLAGHCSTCSQQLAGRQGTSVLCCAQASAGPLLAAASHGGGAQSSSKILQKIKLRRQVSPGPSIDQSPCSSRDNGIWESRNAPVPQAAARGSRSLSPVQRKPSWVKQETVNSSRLARRRQNPSQALAAHDQHGPDGSQRVVSSRRRVQSLPRSRKRGTPRTTSGASVYDENRRKFAANDQPLLTQHCPEAEYIIGVDEVGRGCIAGPVVVGLFAVRVDCLADLLLDVGELPVRDSKLLTEKQRTRIYDQLVPLAHSRQHQWQFKLCYSRPDEVDELGITRCVNNCVVEGLQALPLEPRAKRLVLVDGPPNVAPLAARQLEGGSATWTVVHEQKGDVKLLSIGLASIMAKVCRDQYMCQYEEQAGVNTWSFAQHKGYGTKGHRDAITNSAMFTELHRRSFAPLRELLSEGHLNFYQLLEDDRAELLTAKAFSPLSG